MAVVYGGRKVPARLADPAATAPVDVFVRQLPLRHAQRYLELNIVGDDQGIIELCLGESVEWSAKFKDVHAADRFSVESQVELLTVARELNFTTGEAWIARNKDNREKLRPLLLALHSFQADLMGEAMASLMGSLMGLMESGVSKITASLASSFAAASPSAEPPTKS